MNLNQYIVELLYRNDCVILPGFGAFIANRVPAEINPATREIQPPRKILSFNEALQLSDGLLINHIARKGHISYLQAKEYVEKEVSSMKSLLDKQQFLALPGIGKMVRNPEGRLNFNPEYRNFDLATFGLPSLSFEPIVRSQSRDEKTALLSQRLEGQHITRRSSKTTRQLTPALAVAAFLLLILAFGLSRYIPSNNQSAQQKAGFEQNPPSSVKQTDTLPVEIPGDSATEESKQADAEDIIPSAIPEEKKEAIVDGTGTVNPRPAEEVIEIPKTISPLPEPVADKANWIKKTVVVGCFGVQDNAINLSEKIKADGYRTKVELKGSLHRVGVLVHCDPSEWPSILQEIRDQFGKNAWVI